MTGISTRWNTREDASIIFFLSQMDGSIARATDLQNTSFAKRQSVGKWCLNGGCLVCAQQISNFSSPCYYCLLVHVSWRVLATFWLRQVGEWPFSSFLLDQKGTRWDRAKTGGSTRLVPFPFTASQKGISIRKIDSTCRITGGKLYCQNFFERDI